MNPAFLQVSADGYDLHLAASQRSKTGYRNVYCRPSRDKSQPQFVAEDDQAFTLGRYATAVEAAVAYAKYRLGESERERLVSESVIKILDDNGRLGSERRWLAECSTGLLTALPRRGVWGSSKQASATHPSSRRAESLERPWLPLRALPPAMLDSYESQAQERHNLRVEPALGTVGNPLGDTGVEPTRVDELIASECAAYLHAHWLPDGTCALGQSNKQLHGYATYGKVLGQHDALQQRTHTLLITPPMLPFVRAHFAGFAALELELARQLLNRHGEPVELVFAHGLRQSPHTLASTSFDVHQDTEEYPFIKHTVVVKLTPDLLGEPPSAMRVVGARSHFFYGPRAGDGGSFRAALHHASVAPESECEHLKIAFFFKAGRMEPTRGSRAERACKRSRE